MGLNKASAASKRSRPILMVSPFGNWVRVRVRVRVRECVQVSPFGNWVTVRVRVRVRECVQVSPFGNCESETNETSSMNRILKITTTATTKIIHFLLPPNNRRGMVYKQ